PKRGRKILISRIVVPTTSGRSFINGLRKRHHVRYGLALLHRTNGPMRQRSQAFGRTRWNICGLTSEYQKKYLAEVRKVSICREDTLSTSGPDCWIPFGVFITRSYRPWRGRSDVGRILISAPARSFGAEAKAASRSSRAIAGGQKSGPLPTLRFSISATCS